MEPLYILFVVSCAINGWLWSSNQLLKKKLEFSTFQVLTTGGVLANLLMALHTYADGTKEQEFSKVFGELLSKYPRNLASGAANSYNSMKDKLYGKQ